MNPFQPLKPQIQTRLKVRPVYLGTVSVRIGKDEQAEATTSECGRHVLSPARATGQQLSCCRGSGSTFGSTDHCDGMAFHSRMGLHPPLHRPVFKSHSLRSKAPNYRVRSPKPQLSDGREQAGWAGSTTYMVTPTRTVVRSTHSRVRLPGLLSQIHYSLAGQQWASYLTSCASLALSVKDRQ
uniref:Uncharacterized protein n=1 Tax=Molossus molossus TaxID=27622 RepID=A0A7J8FYQ8_MOLMO|nr:hypothetical protein HJG59_008144 [Molossus molossus]